MQSQNLNPKSVKEIVDFINQTSCQTDMNLFERLNSDELLNIYINCLIFLGAANDYNDFELNENEENLFATVVKENKALKVIKVSALINNLLKAQGQYLLLLDSDDLFINKDIFNICYRRAEKGIDIIEFSGFYIIGNSNGFSTLRLN